MKRTIKADMPRIIITIILGILAVSAMFPFFWMISASMKVEADVFRYPIEWIPETMNLKENYTEIWKPQYQMGLMYWNSIKLTVLATVLDVLFASMAAYAFAKIDFRFSNQLFLLFIACWMIPAQVNLIPKFIIFSKIGLYNTHGGLLLNYLFSAYGVFLIRQYLMSVPDALVESGKIDGASHFKIFCHIIAPIAKPVISTLAILRFVWVWNNYQAPLVFLNSKELFTIQRGLSQFNDPQNGVTYSLLMTASVCAILPLIIVFISMQRYVIDGLAGGSVKG